MQTKIYTDIITVEYGTQLIRYDKGPVEKCRIFHVVRLME